MSRRIVLDTNCLLQAISRRSRFYPIWREFVKGQYELCVTTEILDEYEEILSRHTSSIVGRMVVEAILRANNVVRVDAQFRFGLIETDPDDNKFVDCAIVANAEYIVTDVAHFDVLKDIPFPRVLVMTAEEFLEALECP